MNPEIQEYQQRIKEKQAEIRELESRIKVIGEASNRETYVGRYYAKKPYDFYHVTGTDGPVSVHTVTIHSDNEEGHGTSIWERDTISTYHLGEEITRAEFLSAMQKAIESFPSHLFANE